MSKATTMDAYTRLANYRRQTGQRYATPAQSRWVTKKLRVLHKRREFGTVPPARLGSVR